MQVDLELQLALHFTAPNEQKRVFSLKPLDYHQIIQFLFNILSSSHFLFVWKEVHEAKLIFFLHTFTMLCTLSYALLFSQFSLF
jgi:penicillin-binding protein-related factor A (putative recombinase)